MHPLAEIIRQEIRQSGPISFARFMEQALYHPEHGYYSSDRARLGRRGDFFTNVSVGSAFGQLLALQLTEIWQGMEQERDFALVEQGAHHGELACDILHSIRDRTSEFFRALQYKIVEPCSPLRNRQRENLAEFQDKITWYESIDALESFAGVHFSNELLDALPFHLISAQAGHTGGGGDAEWVEKFVGLAHDEFALIEQPIVNPLLRAHVAKLPTRSPGYQTEVNLAAPQLIRQLSSRLVRGYVMAVDYGFSRARLYDADRRTGTMQLRAHHRLLASPFEDVGESDITAHVDWTSLVQEAEASGFVLSGLTDQYHFFSGILAAFPAFVLDASPQIRRELQTLLHPEMLGRSFQVLALSKGMGKTKPLSGFQLARDLRSHL